MNKYLFIIRQAGTGCDSTVGCGVAARIYEGVDRKDAFDEFLEQFGVIEAPEHYVNEPFERLKSVTVYDITGSDDGTLWASYCEYVNGDAEVKRQQDADYQQYLRLKKKFEGK